MTRWPSGLRRNVKAVVFIGGGSNPPRVILLPFGISFCMILLLHRHTGTHRQLIKMGTWLWWRAEETTSGKRRRSYVLSAGVCSRKWTFNNASIKGFGIFQSWLILKCDCRSLSNLLHIFCDQYSD